MLLVLVVSRIVSMENVQIDNRIDHASPKKKIIIFQLQSIPWAWYENNRMRHHIINFSRSIIFWITGDIYELSLIYTWIYIENYEPVKEKLFSILVNNISLDRSLPIKHLVRVNVYLLMVSVQFSYYLYCFLFSSSILSQYNQSIKLLVLLDRNKWLLYVKSSSLSVMVLVVSHINKLISPRKQKSLSLCF